MITIKITRTTFKGAVGEDMFTVPEADAYSAAREQLRGYKSRIDYLFDKKNLDLLYEIEVKENSFIMILKYNDIFVDSMRLQMDGCVLPKEVRGVSGVLDETSAGKYLDKIFTTIKSSAFDLNPVLAEEFEYADEFVACLQNKPGSVLDSVLNEASSQWKIEL